MDTNEYQGSAARIYQPDFEVSDRDTMAVYDAIGLVNGAYKVADCIKRGVFHRHSIDEEELLKEIGDVLWHVTVLCTTLGLNLAETMQPIIEKLKLRYPEIYSTDDSLRK